MQPFRKIFELDAFSKTLDGNDIALKQRFLVFRTITFISFFVYIIFIVQVATVLPGNLFILFSMLVLFLAIFINYFALAHHKKLTIAYIVLIMVLFALIHVDTYLSGGIKNSANFYLATLVLTAFMLLGTKGGIIAGIISILHLLYFYILSRYTNWISNTLIGDDPALVYLYYFLSTVASIVALTFQYGYIEHSKNIIIDSVKSGRNELALKNTELIKSETNLAAKIKELERKNKELEQFAYVASHDLQEPIRTSSGFVELLKRQYKGKLDERADQYLLFIAESSDRMKVLIKDLLDYSKIGFEEQTVSIDCNEVMKEVMADLGKSIMEAGAVIRYNKLPVIKGYAVAMKQLFQNLVLNAIKFRKENVVPEIIVTGKWENNFWHFSIADNGIGIPKEYFDRIFIIFQRLHTRSEYEGSGIGLSHCKKIIELHNGKIWVESTPGTGTTFHFTIA